MAHPTGSMQSTFPRFDPYMGIRDGVQTHQRGAVVAIPNYYDGGAASLRTVQQRTMNAFICTYCGLPTQSNCVHMERLRRAHTERHFLKELAGLHQEYLSGASRFLEGQRLLRQASRPQMT